jgi:hypothetical protein
MAGGKLLADPIATGLFDGELRPQPSSAQESAGLAAVVLVSCWLAAMRGEFGKSGACDAPEREVLLLPIEGALLPAVAVLLLALPSQPLAQLSAGAVREGEEFDDCGAEFAEDPKLGGVPR